MSCVRFRMCRIIPAYAGSTAVLQRFRSIFRDHPRIRGEHTCWFRTRTPRSGSSPHTRGALNIASRTNTCSEIIPAYAGSTSMTWRRSVIPRDHPRIRGEHFIPCSLANLSKGSSPHTRGARERSIQGYSPLGIIPAYAGSTPSLLPCSKACRDHPRIRGEHCSILISKVFPLGSSPHTRGAREAIEQLDDFSGIIPAYAGSTTAFRLSFPLSWDHPRIRGEHGS